MNGHLSTRSRSPRAAALASGMLGALVFAALLAEPATAQLPTGRLRLQGDGVVGTRLDAVVEFAADAGPAPGAFAGVILSPEFGSSRLLGTSSSCLAIVPGTQVLAVPLNGFGIGRLALQLPSDPALVGNYVAMQSLLPRIAPPVSNCASFAMLSPAAGLELLWTFDDRVAFAAGTSSARWSPSERSGVVVPGSLGGGGRLGSFEPTDGTLAADGAWVFSTDDQLIPASRTLSGFPVRVRDGRFEFLDFVVPAGVTVRFTGSVPVQLHVAGDVRIDGVLDLGAPDLLPASDDPTLLAGAAGGLPGPGAAPGGAGGDHPDLVSGDPAGRAGGDAVVPPASRMFGSPVGSGGAGSPAWPAGLDPALGTWSFFTFFSNQAAGGGGGGGGPGGAGADGRLVRERAPAAGENGPPGSGGVAVPQLRRVAATPRVDLLVGGAGGGGGGVHVYDSVRPDLRALRGEGGGGGGGALLLVCGGSLHLGPAGELRADGGAGAVRDSSHGAFLAPGGGGSGGTLLLQVGGRFRNDGVLSVAGGAGGVTLDDRSTPGSEIHGGGGAPGRIWLQTVAPLVPGQLGSVEPSRDVLAIGSIAEIDDRSVVTSRWRPLPSGADPAAMTFEVYTVRSGLPVLYATTGLPGSISMAAGASPALLYTRFARLDAFGQPEERGPWRLGSSAPVTGANAVQFALQLDVSRPGVRRDAYVVEAVRLRF